MDGLTIGRIVYFVFSAADAAAVMILRQHSAAAGKSIGAGDIYPAMVVRVHGLIEGIDQGFVNLKVFLDGDDTYWATSIPYHENKTRHSWHWSARV